MRHLSALTALVSIIMTPVLVQAQKTYYVDDSCKNRPEWQGGWDLAMRNARSTSTRLASSTDNDFERVVKKIFKVDRSDDRFNRIKGSSTSRIIIGLQGLVLTRLKNRLTTFSHGLKCPKKQITSKRSSRQTFASFAIMMKVSVMLNMMMNIS